MPPSDLYLVELGQPPEAGILLKEDATFVGIDADDPSTPGNRTISLDDGRVLVGYAVPKEASGGDVDDELGVLLVDPANRTVETVLRDTGPVAGGRMDAPHWDDNTNVLSLLHEVPARGALEGELGYVCLAWAPQTAGTGFTETSCVDGERRADALGSDDGETVALGSDGTALLIRRGCLRSPAPGGPCDRRLTADRAGNRTLVSRAAVIRSAYLMKDNETVVYSVRHSTRDYPYPEETFRTTIGHPDERESLYRATVEAIVAED